MKFGLNHDTFSIKQRDYSGHFQSSDDVDLYDIDIRIDACVEDNLNNERALGNTQANCCVTYNCGTIRCM